MIKLELPEDRPDILQEFGEALMKIGSRTGTIVHDPSGKLNRDLAAETHTGFGDGDHNSTEAVQDNPNGLTQEEVTESESIVQDSQHDTKLVNFNPDYCGKAAEPFYKSGPRAGQWKKKKGVSDEAYDAWYAGELANVSGSSPQQQDAAPVNTASAFGNQQAAPTAPTMPGEFMAWVAEMQAGNRLVQADVDAAYNQLGLNMASIFPSDMNSNEVVAQRIGQLYQILNTKAMGA